MTRPMDVLGAHATLDILDDRVIVAGAWHGNRHWLSRAMPAATRSRASTILHLGDFGLQPRESADWLTRVDSFAARSQLDPARPGIDRILVTPGSRDDWGDLTASFATAPGHVIRVSETVWIIPRGFRLTIAGRSVLSFGGGASADWAERDRSHDLWAAELPTVDQVWEASRDGHAAILLSHDAGAVQTPAVARIINDPAAWLTTTDRGYLAFSRLLVNAVLEATTPLLQLHGHYHARGSTAQHREGLPALQVESLGRDGEPGNMLLLRLGDMSATEVEVRQ
ncbi:hypothetical protein ACWPKO_28625 (plasmid) [Coraliomargarita sp. W4R53]